MKAYHYVGLDVHKKMIAYCIKTADGTLTHQGTVDATRQALRQWAQSLDFAWTGVMAKTTPTWVWIHFIPLSHKARFFFFFFHWDASAYSYT